jgi:thiamine-monophosphate kinase
MTVAGAGCSRVKTAAGNMGLSMTEFELINDLVPGLATNATTVAGAGDDCAVVDLGLPGQWVLFKTDAVVEGIHFTPDTPPEKVGYKALARCLSDFAAMAGQPGSAVITLALPPNFEPAWVRGVYAGLNTLARRYGVAIVGGETTTNPERVLISVAMIGTVAKDKCVRRAGTRAGDAVFVTGDLGGSIAGHHLDFVPRLLEAQWLVEHFTVHSMIDLSDGLASDVRHLLISGNLGARLQANAIPVSRAARRTSALHGGKTPLLAALTDGEDFELLFTVPAAEAVPLLDSWKQRFPELRLTCIGKTTTEPGLKLHFPNRVQEITEHGYEHFA